MKILLTTLNSKYVHSNLALKYLYAAGLPNCPGIEIKEFTINNDDDYIYTELVRNEYDVICFSCYIWNIEKIKYLCENLKKAKPEIRIVCGGPEVSYDMREFLMANPAVDAVLFGEGEYAFSMMCRALTRGQPKFPDIKGLAYRAGDEIIVNEPMPPVKFSSLPFPYDVLPVEDDKIIYYESSRGCPYNCSYCISSIDKTVRSLPVSRVKDELSYFIHKRVKQVKFIDRTFNWDKNRCIEILEYLMLMDNGVTNFHFELCGDLIDDRLIQLVDSARSDLFQFEIGIQTTNPLTLKAINRKSEIKKCLSNIKKLSRLGVAHVHVDLITGLPFENMDSLRTSFNNIYPVGADCIQVGFLKLLKGTAIRYHEEFYDYIYRSKAPYEVISNTFMTSREVVRVKQLENVLDLFYNKGGFEFTLNYLITSSEMTPFDFYTELSDYYYIKGYQHRSHSKEDLYRILYGYIMWKCMHSRVNREEAIRYLEQDMRLRLNEDAVKKFMKKGWEFPQEKRWQENIKI